MRYITQNIDQNHISERSLLHTTETNSRKGSTFTTRRNICTRSNQKIIASLCVLWANIFRLFVIITMLNRYVCCCLGVQIYQNISFPSNVRREEWCNRQNKQSANIGCIRKDTALSDSPTRLQTRQFPQNSQILTFIGWKCYTNIMVSFW